MYFYPNFRKTYRVQTTIKDILNNITLRISLIMVQTIESRLRQTIIIILITFYVIAYQCLTIICNFTCNC